MENRWAIRDRVRPLRPSLVSYRQIGVAASRLRGLRQLPLSGLKRSRAAKQTISTSP